MKALQNSLQKMPLQAEQSANAHSTGFQAMDIANDERIQQLNEQIQTEEDPEKLMALVSELERILDEATHEPSAKRAQL